MIWISLVLKMVFFIPQGPVRFYDNERKASILLKQFQGEVVGEVKVGEYCAERDHLDLAVGEAFKWIGK